MKNKYLKPGFFRSTAIRFVAGAALAAIPAQVNAGTPAAPSEPAPAEPAANWATFTIGGAFIDGNKAAYQRAAQQDGDFYGGISSMHWSMEKNGINYFVDGHALFGNEDYDITLGADKEGLGYVHAGYKGFRTWYDGTAGFVPRSNLSSQLYDDDLHVDRGEVWLEAGLRMEKLPEITFRYAHAWRDGNKDSTCWSRTLSGIAYGPSLYSLDETKDTFELDVTHTLGNTDLGLALRYENGSNDNLRLQQSNPGDVNPANDRDITTHENTDYDIFSATIFSETRLNDQMMLTFGYSYLNLDTDTSGERTSINASGVSTTSDHAYSALLGGGNVGMHTINGAFNWTPLADLTLTTSMRAEWEDADALSSFTEAAVAELDSSDHETNMLNEELEVRYTGIEDLVLYVRGEWEQGDGNVMYREVGGDLKFKSADTDQQRYVIGANYYPISGLSISAQYYRRYFDEDYGVSYNPAVGNAFDAQLAGYGSETDDLNLRLTWRALPNLTFVTRYDYQASTMTSQGINGTGVVLNSIDAADVERNILSQSVTWLPVQRAYVQGTISFIWAETDTPANGQVPFRLADSSNDSITANLTAGYALDDKTDLQVGYTYFYASNLEVPLDATGVAGTMPFGTDLEEHMFSVTLNRQISANMLWNMSYGYYTSNDGTSGNMNDFNAHMISTGLQIRF